MPFYAKLLIVIILTILYSVYLVEIYKHITNPERLLPHKKRSHQKRLFFIFIAVVVLVFGIIFMARQVLLPRPIFDLIVVSLEMVFIIPFFGSIFSDLLHHAWPKKRNLRHTLNILNLLIPTCIIIATNMLILFAPQKTIESIAYVLNIIGDIGTACIILILGFLGLTYWQNMKRH